MSTSASTTVKTEYNFAQCVGSGFVSALHPYVWMVALAPLVLATLLTLPVGAAILPLLEPHLLQFAQRSLDYFFSGDASWIRSILNWLLGKSLLSIAITIIVFIGTWLGLMFGLQGLITMPLIVRHIGQRNYPRLEKRGAGQWWLSIANGIVVSVCLFAAWLFALPLLLIPVVNLGILWALLSVTLFLTQRFDVLVEHATEDERHAVWQLADGDFKAIAAVYGGLGLMPLTWLVLPALSGLAFTHCALRALAVVRSQTQKTTIE